VHTSSCVLFSTLVMFSKVERSYANQSSGNEAVSLSSEVPQASFLPPLAQVSKRRLPSHGLALLNNFDGPTDRNPFQVPTLCESLKHMVG